MLPQFVIRFGQSKSKRYEEAVAYSTRMPEYSFSDDVHTVIFDESSLSRFFHILNIVGSWVTTEVEIDGMSADVRQCYSIRDCYHKKIESNDEQYCSRLYNFEPIHEFPCKQIKISRYHRDGLSRFGTYDSNDIFQINRDLLRQKVTLTSLECRLCPAFDLKSVQRGIEDTPLRINPVTDTTWRHVEGQSGVRMMTPDELERELRKERGLKPRSIRLSPWQRLQLLMGREVKISSNITIGPSLNIKTASDAIRNGIKGAQWCADTRNDPCPLCLELDGRTISVEHPDFNRFVPPLHDGCKCFRTYIGENNTSDFYDWQTPSDELLQAHAPHLLK